MRCGGVAGTPAGGGFESYHIEVLYLSGILSGYRFVGKLINGFKTQPNPCNDPFSVNVQKSSNIGEHLFGVDDADFIAANGVSAWNWRAPSYGLPGENNVVFGGRVISVKWGDYVKKIGIDGSPKAIKESIRSAFGLRTRRPFWLEDDEGIVRSIDRDMPLRNYTLNLDEGLSIRINLFHGENETTIHVEEKTFYMEDDFHDFLQRHGFIALEDLNCHKNVDSIDDLHCGELYQGLVAPAE